jgi:hypothetical protein
MKNTKKVIDNSTDLVSANINNETSEATKLVIILSLIGL